MTWRTFLCYVIAVFCLWIFATGCATSGDTVIDRYKADCDATGGTWTTLGCIYHPAVDSERCRA